MSASNWAVCPRCVERAKNESAERFLAAFNAYGNVPAEEYEELRTAAQVKVDDEVFTTFREDYEIYGASTGTITVSYSGHCETCGLGLDFKEEHPFFTASTTAALPPPSPNSCPSDPPLHT